MRSSASYTGLAVAAGVVVGVYFLAVMVLLQLSQLGATQVTIEGLVNKSGGTVWFAAAGIVGAFLLIAVTAFVAVYVFSRLLDRNA